MALFALLQVFLTGWGIWFIRKTLDATEAAVEEAGDATEAARAVAALTREQFIAERRPWMAPKIVEPVDPIQNMDFGVKLGFENTGNSPAFDVRVHVTLHIDKGGDPASEYRKFVDQRRRYQPSGDVIFPGDHTEARHYIPFPRSGLTGIQRRNELASASITPFIFYVVVYRSEFTDAAGQKLMHHTGGFYGMALKTGSIRPNLRAPVDQFIILRPGVAGAFLAS